MRDQKSSLKGIKWSHCSLKAEQKEEAGQSSDLTGIGGDAKSLDEPRHPPNGFV